jgi:hypothetical protein
MNFFERITLVCAAMSKKREVELIDKKIADLQEKKSAISGNSVKEIDAAKVKKTAMSCTLQKDELIIDVAANVQVKDICRNIERKLKRNLQAKNKDDFQLLYNHLYYFYSIKHQTTMPNITLKNGNVINIADYVKMRSNSVIKDVSCHINFA